ncbi:hypothetical protein JAAARDRAFT_61952 [Jaapia argillacea MUCL 33604]|uniref:Uncharacterized protein n=1 Tax=Jaapia argillacea MUCL 33604 TaxID=933084 RepID=A0A067PF43_9AGAM|nr:hypothetical protein JAAARDRAFT_61952 [Jaapia argillacea MUCL 33604]
MTSFLAVSSTPLKPPASMLPANIIDSSSVFGHTFSNRREGIDAIPDSVKQMSTQPHLEVFNTACMLEDQVRTLEQHCVETQIRCGTKTERVVDLQEELGLLMLEGSSGHRGGWMDPVKQALDHSFDDDEGRSNVSHSAVFYNSPGEMNDSMDETTAHGHGSPTVSSLVHMENIATMRDGGLPSGPRGLGFFGMSTPGGDVSTMSTGRLSIIAAMAKKFCADHDATLHGTAQVPSPRRVTWASPEPRRRGSQRRRLSSVSVGAKQSFTKKLRKKIMLNALGRRGSQRRESAEGSAAAGRMQGSTMKGVAALKNGGGSVPARYGLRIPPRTCSYDRDFTGMMEGTVSGFQTPQRV